LIVETISLGVAASGAIGTAMSKADDALFKSIIFPSHLKGNAGESFMGGVYLKNFLSQGKTNWQLISSQHGRQGIEGIFIRFDSNGDRHLK